MVGVILSGGQSSRMGSDKGLIQIAGGKPWAQRALDLVQQVCALVVVSVNTGQLCSYSTQFAPQLLVVDNPELAVKGPLLGLLSTHERFPNHDLLLLASDMAQMNEIILRTLIEQYHTYAGKEAYLFLNEGFPEPLCAIYTAPALARLLESYRTGQQDKWSMKYILSKLNGHSCPVPLAWKSYFANFNTKEDLPGT